MPLRLNVKDVTFLNEIIKEERTDCKDNSIQLFNCPIESEEYKIAGFFQSFSESYLENKYNIKIPYEFLWLDSKDPHFNAVTTKNPATGRYFILLYRSLITDLLNTSVQIIRNQKISIDTSIINCKDFDFLSLDPLYSESEKIILNLIFLFIIYHEVGHIACGHLELLAKKNSYEEQAMELYADNFAMNAVIFYMFINCKISDPIVIQRIIECYLEANQIWWSIDQNNNTGSIHKFTNKNASHPHPLVRLLFQKKNVVANFSGLSSLSPLIEKSCDRIYKRLSKTVYCNFLAEEQLNLLYTKMSPMESIAKTYQAFVPIAIASAP